MAQVTTGKRSSLFNVHCINSGGQAKNQFYEFDLTVSTAHPNLTIKQQGIFGATSSSYDFNPHLAANNSRDCFTVWSATDPSAGKNAMVYFGGRRADADLHSMGVNPTPLFTFATRYDDLISSPNRWGDYSAITIDPANHLKAWLTNETIFGTSNPSTIWGTRISAVSY